MGNEDVNPNTISYNSAISAWANSRVLKAGIQAGAILQSMEDQYNLGNKEVKPNTISYSSAITAWAMVETRTLEYKQRHSFNGCRNSLILVTRM
jgi:hypothetical protein